MKNQVQLIGNVGKPPEETAKTKDGKPVVRFSIAQDGSIMDAATQKLVKKDPQWFQIACFGSTAERALGLGKGDLIFIQGELKSSSYDTNTGERRTSVEVIARTLFRISNLKKSVNEVAYAAPVDEAGDTFSAFDGEMVSQ